MNKHFFKTLIIFVGMISVGLLGVLLVSYINDYNTSAEEYKANVVE